MTAAEIIAQIEKLPPEERAQIRAWLERQADRMEETAASFGAGVATVEYISDEDFERVVPGIFEKHRELFRRLAQ